MVTGILLPSFRRAVSAEVAGRSVNSLESVSAVKNGTLLRVTEGKEAGSRVDGSKYVVAHVQIRPGTVIRVAGYGDEQIAQIRAVEKSEQPFSAVLYPMARGGYKLAEFEPAPAEPQHPNA